MRLRNVKNAKDIINNSKYIVLNPYDYKGKWNSLFKNNNPINIEIGMGKGNFIIMKENDAGEVKELFGKTIFGFGIRPYEEVLPKVFPWANLVLDEEYYEMYGDQEYIQYKKQQNLCLYMISIGYVNITKII